MKPQIMIAFDTAAVGGPGKGILQLLRHVPAAEARLTVATFRSARHGSSEFLERVEAQAGDAIVLYEKTRFDPLPIFQAAAEVRRRGINLLQSHGYKGHLLCAILSRMLELPWIAVMNGYTSEDLKVRIFHSFDRVSLRLADMIVGVSEELCAAGRRIKGADDAVRLIANAVDPEDLAGSGGGGALRARCAPHAETLIGTFGRLSAEKGHALLIEAFSGLPPDDAAARLLVVGDGVLRAQLVRQTEAAGAADRVMFEGYQSRMRDYFDAVDLLVLPSLHEGLPNVVLEAMAYGVPVLSTAVGAVPQLLQDGETGWLCPPGDAQALRSKLRQVLERRTAWPMIAERAKSSLYPRYCPRERAKRFLNVYQEVLQRRTVVEDVALSSAS